jgi:hypothetical protein
VVAVPATLDIGDAPACALAVAERAGSALFESDTLLGLLAVGEVVQDVLTGPPPAHGIGIQVGSGIASAEAIGRPTVTLGVGLQRVWLTGNAIVSAGAFGQPTVTHTENRYGFAVYGVAHYGGS